MIGTYNDSVLLSKVSWCLDCEVDGSTRIEKNTGSVHKLMAVDRSLTPHSYSCNSLVNHTHTHE